MFEFIPVEDEDLSEKYHRIAEMVFEESYFSEYDISDFWGIDDEGEYYIIQLNKENIGVLSFNPDENGAIIDTFGLIPDYQGKGLGKKVFYQAEDELLDKFSWLSVEFIADNVDLFNFYFSCGFKMETIEVYVYDDDQIIYQNGFLEFKDKYQDTILPDFIPWVVMTKEFEI